MRKYIITLFILMILFISCQSSFDNGSKLDENNLSPSAYGGDVLTFKNMQDFKSMLETLSFDDTRKIDYIKTVNNLPEGYKESFVEWAGDSNYVINFVSENQIGLSFHMYDNEEDLYNQQIESLKDMGSCKVEYVMSEFGEIEISVYDTDEAKNYRRTYIEFTYNDIEYVISEFYAPDNSLLYALTFVYNENQSFSCYNDGEILSYKDMVSINVIIDYIVDNRNNI